MTNAKETPLFGGTRLPPHFTPHQITDIGSKVFRMIQMGWRFGDAFNTVAHRRMIFKANQDGRYEKLKLQIEEYCREQDFYLLMIAKHRPRGNHLRSDRERELLLPRHARLKPGIEVEVDENPYFPRQIAFNF